MNVRFITDKVYQYIFSYIIMRILYRFCFYFPSTTVIGQLTIGAIAGLPRDAGSARVSTTSIFD